MPYQFKTSESVPDNVRRIATEEINSAISHLRTKDPGNIEEAVHEARKAIKRLRALLRLVRPELGRSFRRENAALRDIGRSLSDLRDSSIVLETFDTLCEDAAEREELMPVRAGLEERKRAKEENINSEKILRNATKSLMTVGERSRHWPLESDGFEAIADGLKREYGSGRKAMAAALRKDDSLLFHEWRKRAKCQLFHMRLLKAILETDSRAQEQTLHKLETALGDDHNLLILRQHLDSHPQAFGGKKTLRHSIRLVGEREAKLRNEAQVLGEQIYAQKPKEFLERLRAEWHRAYIRPAARKRPKAGRVSPQVTTPAA